jgi:riboflavin synthase
MFTGLVETTGTVASVKKAGNGMRILIRPAREYEVGRGDSVAVNGVCLTVIEPGDLLPFDVSPETLRSTNLGELSPGDVVNLERAMRLSDRLGGHLVTGHVDGIGTIRRRREAGEYTFFTFETGRELLRYIVRKGSIAVDGISLTVTDMDRESFSVAIIPHTLSATNIGTKREGARVNLETDIIGKYVEKFIQRDDGDEKFMKLLREKGFADD